VGQRRPFDELKEVFRTLHGPRGCPWDKRQTYRTLIPYLREEVQELIDALRGRDPDDVKEELGDVLLHVLFFSILAEKEGTFDIDDVIKGLIAKLKRRHPHVFGSRKVASEKEIIRNWHAIKRLEKARKRRER
jgi:tetrapyrrole methylase family protein/MazG family protein